MNFFFLHSVSISVVGCESINVYRIKAEELHFCYSLGSLSYDTTAQYSISFICWNPRLGTPQTNSVPGQFGCVSFIRLQCIVPPYIRTLLVSKLSYVYCIAAKSLPCSCDDTVSAEHLTQFMCIKCRLICKEGENYDSNNLYLNWLSSL